MLQLLNTEGKGLFRYFNFKMIYSYYSKIKGLEKVQDGQLNQEYK